MARSNTMNKRKVVKKNNTLVVKITNKTKKATKQIKQTKKNKKNVSSRRKTLKNKVGGGFGRQPHVKKTQMIGYELKLPADQNTEKKMKEIINNVKVVFFDFDCTISDEHSGGYPVNTQKYKINEVWKDVMSKLQNMGKEIVINTRGMQDLVTKVMETEFPGINITVMGADESIPISNNKKGINRKKWAEIKTIFIEQYMLNNIDKKKVLFFDDTKENIEEAREKGYVYSFYHRPKEATLLGNFLKNVLIDDQGYVSGNNVQEKTKEEPNEIADKIKELMDSNNNNNKKNLESIIKSLSNKDYKNIYNKIPFSNKNTYRTIRAGTINADTQAYNELVQSGIKSTIETEA